MCGICGKLLLGEKGSVDERLLRQMTDVMRHRGPDDEGFYISGRVGLGHKRLSIIDLSTGKQPICNEDGTVWIVFNGEIYNYREIRKVLVQKGHSFASQPYPPEGLPPPRRARKRSTTSAETLAGAGLAVWQEHTGPSAAFAGVPREAR